VSAEAAAQCATKLIVPLASSTVQRITSSMQGFLSGVGGAQSG
jgi:hypothetical protein